METSSAIHRGSLSALRSVLGALVLVGLFGVDRHAEPLRSRHVAVLAAIRDDRGPFGGGVALLSPGGTTLWSEPPGALPPQVQGQPWFQRVLAQRARASTHWLTTEAHASPWRCRCSRAGSSARSWSASSTGAIDSSMA